MAEASAGASVPAPSSSLHQRSAWLADAIACRPAWAVLICAIAVRLLALIALRDYIQDGGGDTLRYASLADDLLSGRPYGSASGDLTRVPGYPIFVALHRWALGPSLIWVSLSQAILDSLTAVMMGRLAVMLSGRRLGWGVGFLWALYPPAVLNVPLIFPYPLQTFWLTLAIMLMISSARQGSVWRAAAAGACWGAACLTRAGYLMILPMLAMLPLLRGWRPHSGQRLKRVAAFFAAIGAAAITVGWWTARDYGKPSYRLEYLFLNGHERRAVRLLLRPVEPAHEWLAANLNDAFSPAPTAPVAAADTAPASASPSTPPPAPPVSPSVSSPALPLPPIAIVVTPTSAPTGVREDEREALVKTEIADLRWQYRRRWDKLRDAFLAPDGCVQLRCTGPPGGFWRYFKEHFTDAPVSTAATAFGRPCMTLKVAMYLQHGLLLLLAVPALAWRLRRLDGFGLFAAALILYTLAGIVLATNYGSGLGAVPRYAFALMPVLILLVGTWLIACEPWLRERSAVRA